MQILHRVVNYSTLLLFDVSGQILAFQYYTVLPPEYYSLVCGMGGKERRVEESITK